jgi:hypothetical protein
VRHGGPLAFPQYGAPTIKKTTRPENRTAAKKENWVKATLLLPPSVDFRLSALAAYHRTDRSGFAAKILDQGLQRFALDESLREFSGQSKGSAISADDVSQSTTIA